MKKKPTIAELQAILDSDEGVDVRILPNGELTTVDRRSLEERINALTEDLGAMVDEIKGVDPRAWQHLLIYVPAELLIKRLEDIKQRDENEEE